jgi:lauroyl/myristoyl acyltransferase
VNLRAEARAAVELWLVPGLLALLPYRAGIALARAAARRLPLYGDTAQAGAREWCAVAGASASADFVRDYRFAQLVDHMDLFWSLTRSRRFLEKRLTARPPLPLGQPLLVLSFHFGQGLWLMHWLAHAGVKARFVSIRLARAEAQGALQYAYQRLRIRCVERLAGIAPIFTGGARREIAASLAQGSAVYGLIDVPVPGAGRLPANATLLAHPVRMPEGLLESAQGSGAQVLVLTAHANADGMRFVQADAVGPLAELTVARLAALLERRLREAPAAWHFWHLWRSFLAEAA